MPYSTCESDASSVVHVMIADVAVIPDADTAEITGGVVSGAGGAATTVEPVVNDTTYMKVVVLTVALCRVVLLAIVRFAVAVVELMTVSVVIVMPTPKIARVLLYTKIVFRPDTSAEII